MIVYLARDIPAFVIYCVNGESGSSLLIESTNTMIYIIIIYILSDFSSDYRSSLIYLNMLPLMMQFELTSDSFNILDYVSFCSGTSRSAT